MWDTKFGKKLKNCSGRVAASLTYEHDVKQNSLSLASAGSAQLGLKFSL